MYSTARNEPHFYHDVLAHLGDNLFHKILNRFGRIFDPRQRQQRFRFTAHRRELKT